jgi:hypothetical protein
LEQFPSCTPNLFGLFFEFGDRLLFFRHFIDGNYFSRLDWNSKGFVVENLGEFVWRSDGVEGYSFLKKDSTERVLSKKISDDRLFLDKRTMFEKIKDDTGISLAINI